MKEKLLEELENAWNSGYAKSDFLLSESTENDTQEILLMLKAITETALKQNRINKQQWLVCQASIDKISTLLAGKMAVPYLKKTMPELTFDQLLQSLLLFTDTAGKGMLALANRSDPKAIDLNLTGSGAITFLYNQLSGDATCYDRYVNRYLPINGDAEFCCYDNYFPVYKFMEKYFPEKYFRLVSNLGDATGKYIYVVSFKYFPAFAAKNSNNFLAVVPKYILQDCRRGKAIVIYNDLDGATSFAPIIGKFKSQLKAAGIIKSFYLLSGDLANKLLTNSSGVLQKIIRFFSSNSNLPHFFTISYFEEALAYSKLTYYPEYTYAGKLNLIKSQPALLRHFICLNRAIKDYRVYISYYFYRHNLLSKAYISQGQFTGNKDFEFGYNKNTAIWSNVENRPFENFKQSLPWNIDFNEVKNAGWDAVPIDALNKSFCWVVTETSFDCTLPEQSFRLTEKTYKPIAFFMPFIMVGNPFTLKKLRESGYQTFSKWWDESYDDVIDPIGRMEKITELILKISQLNQPELISIYEEMKPVLMRNYEILINSKSATSAMESILINYLS